MISILPENPTNADNITVTVSGSGLPNDFDNPLTLIQNGNVYVVEYH